VEVHVQVQSAAEPLEDRHRARSPSADAAAACAVTLEAEQHPHGHTEHRARQRVIPHQQISQPVRQAQHPLAHRHPRQYPVDQPGRALGHASPAATRAEASALHENGTSRSSAHSVHRRRAKPCARIPQVRKSRNSCSTNAGNGAPSYAEGRSMRTIAHELNAEGIPFPAKDTKRGPPRRG
jgi:hypothetical protein